MGRKLYAKGEGFNPTTGIDDVEGLREELDALKGGSGGGGGDTTAIERRLTTAEGEIDALQGDVAAQSEEIAAVGAKVNTLQGSDTGKSVRAIAAEETAKIVGGAPANYDTLKEIADYISSDAEGAAELRNKVNKNATDIATLQSTKASKVEAQGYATTAKNEAIAAAATDAQEKANTAENNANDYTDGAVDDLAKGQVATNKANIASLSATVKTNTNNIATHTQQIANLDSNKLGKTEKAADSAKADVANNSILLDGKYGYQYGQNILNETVDIDAMPNGVYGGRLFNASHSLVEFPANADGYGAFLSAAYGKYGIQFIGRHDGYLYARVNDGVVRQWKQLAFTDSTVANAINATQLGGVGADGYTRVLKGITTTANNHLYIGTLPASSSATRDSISIRGTIGDFGGDRDFVDIAIGRRGGLWFKGLSTFRYTGTLSYWDIVVNDAGEVYVLLYAPYCAYHIEVSSQEVTIYGVHGTSPSDTNWRYLREELEPFDKIKSEELEVAGNIKASGMLTTGSDAHVGGVVVADGGITSTGDIDASGNNIKGNLDGTIKKTTRDTNLFLLGFAQEAGAAAKPYVTTQVSVNNGVLTIKGLRVEGDVEITGNTVIGGRLTSAASYQSSPISTTSEEGVPTTEEQLRAQISTLEERVAVLEQLIAQNNG